MNKRIIISIVVGVIAVGAVVLVVVNLTTGPSPETAGSTPTTGNVTKPLTGKPEHRLWALPPARAATKLAPVPPEFVDIKDDQDSVTGQGVRLTAGKVLATVNQIPLTLADMSPVTSGQMEVVMETEEYELRLAKAVEAELTLQAARSQGVGLDLVQQERVTKISQRHAETLAKYKEEGVTWHSVTPEQIALQERQMAVSILQQNLVKKEAGVSPSVDPAEQEKYEAALRAMMARLKGNANVVTYSSASAAK